MARRIPLPRTGHRASPPSRSAPAASGACATLTCVRVVIADDHRLVLDGIKRALEADGGFEIVGETQTGTQVLPLVGKTNPDLVLLDVRMPHMDGLACLDQIAPRHPDVKVVMLSASHEPGARRVRAATRRERLRHQDRQPGRPAAQRYARRSRGTSHTAIGGDETERASAEGARA